MIVNFSHTLDGSADKIFYNSTQVYPQVLIESNFDQDKRVYSITSIQLRTYTDFNGYTNRKYYFPLDYNIELNIPGKKTYTFTGEFIGDRNTTYYSSSVGGWTPYEVVPINGPITLNADAYNEEFPNITVSISIETDYYTSSGKKYHYSSNGSNIMYLPKLAKTPEVTQIDVVNNPDVDKDFVSNLLLSINGKGTNITSHTYAHIRIANDNAIIMNSEMYTDKDEVDENKGKFYIDSSDLLPMGQYDIYITLRNQTTYDKRKVELIYKDVWLKKPNVTILQQRSGKDRIVHVFNGNKFEVQLYRRLLGASPIYISPEGNVEETISDMNATTFWYYTSTNLKYAAYGYDTNTLEITIRNTPTIIDLIPAIYLSLGSIDYSGNNLKLKGLTCIGLSKDTIFTLKLDDDNDKIISYKLLMYESDKDDLSWSDVDVWVQIPDDIYFVDNAPNITKITLSTMIGSTLLEAQVNNLDIPLNSNSYIYLNGYKLGNLFIYNNGKFVTGNMKVFDRRWE